MPFQPLGSINTSLWRYASADLVTGLVTENYVNLIEVKKMKVFRDVTGQSVTGGIFTPNGSPPINVGPNPKVWLWFATNRIDDRDADLTLSGSEAKEFIAQLDAIYT
jgi:hypothetical protein